MEHPAVLPLAGVHVVGLHHVNRRGDKGGAEAGAESRGEVAEEAVGEQAPLNQRFLDGVIADQLGGVHHRVAGNVGAEALPQAGHALCSVDSPVGVHRAVVEDATIASSSSGLGLHANLHDVCWLKYQKNVRKYDHLFRFASFNALTCATEMPMAPVVIAEAMRMNIVEAEFEVVLPLPLFFRSR